MESKDILLFGSMVSLHTLFLHGFLEHLVAFFFESFCLLESSFSLFLVLFIWHVHALSGLVILWVWRDSVAHLAGLAEKFDLFLFHSWFLGLFLRIWYVALFLEVIGIKLRNSGFASDEVILHTTKLLVTCRPWILIHY